MALTSFVLYHISAHIFTLSPLCDQIVTDSMLYFESLLKVFLLTWWQSCAHVRLTLEEVMVCCVWVGSIIKINSDSDLFTLDHILCYGLQTWNKTTVQRRTTKIDSQYMASYLKRGKTLFRKAPNLHAIFGWSVCNNSTSLNIDG